MPASPEPQLVHVAGSKLLKGTKPRVAYTKDHETIAFPQQDLDAIAAPIEEEEEMPGEGILSEIFASHALQTIESFSHVRWLGSLLRYVLEAGSCGNISGLPVRVHRVRQPRWLQYEAGRGQLNR